MAIGGPVACPHLADDIEVYWTGNAITSCTWAHKDKVLTDPCNVPPSANDFHLTVHKIKEVFWTENGAIVSSIPVPKGANDLEFSFQPAAP